MNQQPDDSDIARPVDMHGNLLGPLDLVILGEIPEHYYADSDPRTAAVLRSYAGCYGLITFEMNERYRNNNKSHPGWVSGDSSAVYVISHAINDNHISAYDFWLSPTTLRKIPFNYLIMNVFADFPWELIEATGSTSHFVSVGTDKYEIIKSILETPYDTLKRAHDAAAHVLATRP